MASNIPLVQSGEWFADANDIIRCSKCREQALRQLFYEPRFSVFSAENSEVELLSELWSGYERGRHR